MARQIGTRKGQVTIFIILGIFIFAAAMFLFLLTSTLQKENLTTAQEDVISTLFEKESLRIFAQDCLEDSLEEGLILLGQQGRLWQGQSGGSLTFQENYNGVLAGPQQTQVYLGVSYDEDEIFPESYPCTINQTTNPDFCRYEDPNIAEFGSKTQITRTTIQSDLKNYMIKEVEICAKEFLESELSYAGNIRVGEIDLDVSIETEGFDISVTYPFELIVDSEKYFHLEDFDFFYISAFDTFLTQAVTQPLRNEARDPNYKFSEEELEANHLFRSMPIFYQKEESSNGNWLINYFVDEGTILKNSAFEYTVAIENRPPALNYIGRQACTEFDYLVIKGFENDMGGVYIESSAVDPDDDQMTLQITPSPEASFNSIVQLEDNAKLTIPYETLSEIEDFPAGIYTIQSTATDEHGLIDSQETRILIDNEMRVEVTVENPYGFSDESGRTIVSIEDPAFINVQIPSASQTVDATESASLSYTDNLGVESWTNLQFDITTQRENCFSFPWPGGQNTNCNTNDYIDEFENWNQLKERSSLPQSSFINPTNNGQLTLEFSRDYCTEYQDPASDFEALKVVGCIPYQNETHPFAYPYHEETYDSFDFTYQAGTYSQDQSQGQDVNPFFATHSCCNPSTMAPYLEEQNHVCYKGLPGCFGNIQGHTTSSQGIIVEEPFDVCSGERGNICGDGDSSEYRLYQNKMVCGSSDFDSCNLNLIDDLCEGKNAWGFTTDPSTGEAAWCHGRMGCETATRVTEAKPIVYVGSGDPPTNINSLASQRAATNDLEDDPLFQFQLNCPSTSSNTEVIECDANYDGRFDGICIDGTCQE